MPPTMSTENSPVLDSDAAIARMDNDPEIYWEVFPIFIEETAQHIAALYRAIAAHDSTQCRLMAHSIKSSAATIGAEQMRAQAALAEHRAISEELSGLPELLQAIEDCYQAVLAVAREGTALK